MRKTMILAVSAMLTGLLTFAAAVHADENQIESRVVQELAISAEELEIISVESIVSPLNICVHQENHILVTFEVYEEFETGNRPQFNFDGGTGVLYINQEPCEHNAATGIEIQRGGGTNISMNIRGGNLTHRFRPVIVDGRIVDAAAFREIESISFIDTGLVTVFLPKYFTLQAFHAETHNLSVSIFGENSLTISEVFAEAINGGINMNDVNVHSIDFIARNGSLALSGATASGGVTAEARNGSVSVSNSQISGPFHAIFQNGSIDIQSSGFADGFTAEVHSGSINLTRAGADMDRASISAGSHGRIYIDGRRIN